MTNEEKQTKIYFIKNKCIEANPSILDLVNGCEVEGGGIIWNGGAYWNYDEMTDNLDIPPEEIIGRPIRLADVLLAIETNVRKKKNLFTFETFFPAGLRIWYNTINWADWNLLKDDIKEQSEETINFLYELLYA